MIKTFLKKLEKYGIASLIGIGINNANDFLKNTINDNADEFIMVDVHKNTSFVKGSNSDKLVMVLHSVIDNDLKTLLVQANTVFSYLSIFDKFKT